jgi:hypothetical protein
VVEGESVAGEEDKAVVGEEDEAMVDAMEERDGVQDEAEAWVQAHLCRSLPLGSS